MSAQADAVPWPGSAGVLKRLSVVDRFLPVWIFAAMVLGLLLGRVFPELGAALDRVQVSGVSVPIGVGLLWMMYPVLAKVRYGSLGEHVGNGKLLGTSLVLNWVIGPVLMFVLAWVMLPDLPEYRNGLIIVGLARCIAMVLLWNTLACGSGELAAVLVALNSLFQVLTYSVLGYFFLAVVPGWLGAAGTTLDVSMLAIAKSVLLFLGIPLLAGYLTRRILVARRGEAWYEGRFLPRIGPTALNVSMGQIAKSVGIFLGVPLVAGFLTRTLLVARKGSAWYDDVFMPKFGPTALLGLLYTIVLMFAMQGDRILDRPLDVLRIALPLLIYFGLMFGVAFTLGRRLGFSYPDTAALSFTAAGNNFELAIAVAIGTFGLASGEAVAAVVGPLIEVPALVGLVYVALWARRFFPVAAAAPSS